MTFTADTLVVNVAPRMSRDAFVAWLQSVKSPAVATGGAGYDAIVANKVDPLFCAACFWHESNAATNPAAIVAQFGTNNPGNCRSSRTGSGTVVQTPRGAFVKYPNWVEGWKDLAFRLVDPSYVYAQDGCTTPNTIIPKFAPSTDQNDPVGYLQSVLAFMNEHATIGGGTVTIPWYPNVRRATTPYQSPGSDNGRLFPATVTDVVMHHTDGTYQSAISWFQSPGRGDNGTSAHFVISRTGEVTQLVSLLDIAWHAGQWAENVKSIGIEHEQSQINGGWQDWPDALLTASSQLLTWLKGQMAAGFNVYPHSNFTSTTCPGDLPIDEIVKRMGGVGQSPVNSPTTYTDPVTGYTIIGGMRARWKQLQDALSTISPDEIYLVIGHPIENEHVDSDGVTRQRFEHVTLAWVSGQSPPRFDILEATINPFVAAS